MLGMDSSRGNNLIAPNDTFSDSMQFTSNYSIIGRDEQSFIARNNIQTTQSSLLGVEMGEISWMPPDEISLFQSRIMSPGTSRLPPEGAEKKSRGETKEALNVSNLSECSHYKDLLELVNKYDFEDLSVSEVPDKILPQTGGQSHSERINKLRAEGKEISVPSTEQLLALLKESEGLTPTKIYDRIMESSYSKRTENYKSTCNGQTQWKSRSTQIINQPHTIRKEQPAEIEDSKLNSKMFEDSSFVAMSASILDKDERSMMAKYGGLNKQADITCPGDQSTLPWNISNVTIFDLETTGGLPRHRFENSMQATADAKDSTRTILHDPSGLDDLVDRIYALSPSTSFSSISKMILDSARAKCDTSGAFDWSSLGGNDKPTN